MSKMYRSTLVGKLQSLIARTLDNDVLRVLDQQTDALDTAGSSLAEKRLLTTNFERVRVRSPGDVPRCGPRRRVRFIVFAPVVGVNGELRVRARPRLADLAGLGAICARILAVGLVLAKRM
jgi:hypothetical protein